MHSTVTHRHQGIQGHHLRVRAGTYGSTPTTRRCGRSQQKIGTRRGPRSGWNGTSTCVTLAHCLLIPFFKCVRGARWTHPGRLGARSHDDGRHTIAFLQKHPNLYKHGSRTGAWVDPASYAWCLLFHIAWYLACCRRMPTSLAARGVQGPGTNRAPTTPFQGKMAPLPWVLLGCRYLLALLHHLGPAFVLQHGTRPRHHS